MKRIAVAAFGDRAKAEPLCKRLAEAGINAEIHNELGLERLWFVSKTHGVRVEVPADQVERAGQMLLNWDASGGALREAIHCPECKSLRVQYPQYARNSVLPNVVVGLMATFGHEKEYYCEDCHFTWPDESDKPSIPRRHGAPWYFIEGFEDLELNPKRSEPKPPGPVA